MKKTQFHCNYCESPCEIYKKGKKHKVLVCPQCGVLATNPSVVGKVVKRAGKAILGEIPGASLVMEGLGLAGDLTKKKSKDTPVSARTSPVKDRAYYDYKSKLLTEALK